MLPGVTILLLTEDSGGDAHATHAALLRAMLRLVAPGHDASRVAVDPADEKQRAVMRGNRWDSGKAAQEPERRALVRSIATRICQNNLHFVAFHYDGDRPWAERGGCPRHAVFAQKILTPVRQLVANVRDGAQQRKALARVVTLVPHHSVEAWLYQNTSAARGLCVRHHDGRDAERFDAWEADRGALDEVEKPKEATTLADRHNRELAEDGFPAATVYGVGKSFHAAVEALRACDDLRGALVALTPKGSQRP